VASDFDVLRQAYQREEDVRNKKALSIAWEPYSVGATRDQVNRLVEEGMVTIGFKSGNLTKFKLTEKGRNLVSAQMLERKMKLVDAGTLLEAMSLIVGFDDLKETIANAIASGKRIHFLLSGPPACAKSLVLEAVRSSVESSFIVFGSRTSASGLSEVLFEHQPTILLVDEADKVHMDTFSVLLGLMESGEILETKSGKVRGIKLNCMVIAACNSYEKMPREFLSRFALHAAFPHYSRDEFIDVCKGFLPRTENCSLELAEMIGKLVYDYDLGDVRKARGVCQLMSAPTEEEVRRVIELMMKYSPDGQAQASTRQKRPRGARLI
jgi:hypothetical protein